MALRAPDVWILDLKDPVFDEKKPTARRETDKARRSPRSSTSGVDTYHHRTNSSKFSKKIRNEIKK